MGRVRRVSKFFATLSAVWFTWTLVSTFANPDGLDSLIQSNLGSHLRGYRTSVGSSGLVIHDAYWSEQNLGGEFPEILTVIEVSVVNDAFQKDFEIKFEHEKVDQTLRGQYVSVENLQKLPRGLSIFHRRSIHPLDYFTLVLRGYDAVKNFELEAVMENIRYRARDIQIDNDLSFPNNTSSQWNVDRFQAGHDLNENRLEDDLNLKSANLFAHHDGIGLRLEAEIPNLSYVKELKLVELGSDHAKTETHSLIWNTDDPTGDTNFFLLVAPSVKYIKSVEREAKSYARVLIRVPKLSHLSHENLEAGALTREFRLEVNMPDLHPPLKFSQNFSVHTLRARSCRDILTDNSDAKSKERLRLD